MTRTTTGPTLDTLLSDYMEAKGLTLAAAETPRGLRSPLTRYVNEHWEELLGPGQTVVGGVCTIPEDVLKSIKNPRQGMRQSMLTVLTRRYGDEYRPAEGNRAVTARQVLQKGKLAYCVAVLLAKPRS